MLWDYDNSVRRNQTHTFATKNHKRNISYSFLALAATLMLVSQIYSQPFDSLKGRIQDRTSPLIGAFSKPIAAIGSTFNRASEFIRLQNEILALHEENINLKARYDKLIQLQGQNNALRALMNYAPEPGASWLTARVTSNIGGVFSRSLLIAAGKSHDLEKGQAVVTGNGLIGRIAQVNEKSAEVILISDISSSIKVMVEHTRQKAMLSGDNSALLKLKHLPDNAQIQVGARLVTSGANDTLPVGVPVGVVVAIEADVIKVQPMQNLNRLELVRIITQNSAVSQSAASFSENNAN